MSGTVLWWQRWDGTALSSWLVVCGVLTLLATAAGAQGSTPRQVEAIAFEQSPTIDGRFDEAAWQAGEWHSGFTHIRSEDGSIGGEPAHVATRFKIGFDERALYLAVQMERPGDVPLVMRTLERDGDLWKDDTIELMVNPNPSVDQYIHVIVSAGGAVFDSVRMEDGLIADAAFDTLLEQAVQIHDDSWTVEMAVPLADLGLTGDESDVWTFNVARSSHATGRQVWSSFAPMGDNILHQPPKFARLKVEGISTEPFLWTVEPRGTSRTVMDGQQLKLETTVRVMNRTDSYQFFELAAQLLQGDQAVGGATFHRGIDAGGERIYELAIPYAGDGEARVAIELRSLETGTLWRRQQYQAALDHMPIDIRLTQPGYRDTIYATQHLDAITGEIALNLPAEVLGAYRLEVALRSPEDAVLASTAVETLRPRVAFELPLPGEMPDGRYHVVVDLTSSAGGDDYQDKRPLTKLPPPAHGSEVRLDSNRILHVNGQPVVPFGAFSIRPHEDIEHVGRQGYNAVVAYRFHTMGDEGRQAWLDLLHANGMMAIVGPRAGFSEDNKRLYTEEEEQMLRAYVQRWSRHPALLAWYMKDEPEIFGTLPARLEQLYGILRDADPYHPTIILNNTLGGIWTYGRYTDILMPDPYPGFYKRGGTRRRMDYVYHFIRAAEHAVDHQRAAWAVPQAFNWADLHAGRQDERVPNLIELRNMYFQTVHAKGTGWVWYTYMRSRGYPEIRIGLGFLARETQLLRDIITATDRVQPVRANLDEQELLTHYREVDGHHYVLAVNLVNEPRDVRLVLPLDDAPKQWHVMSEGRSVDAPRGQIAETLQPFAAHLYTTNETLANRLSIQEAQQRIERAKRWGSVGLEGPHPPLPDEEIEFTRQHGW